jgi:predicted ATPase
MKTDPWSTTDLEPARSFPLEILQEHKKLTLKYRNAMKALGGVGKKTSVTLQAIEEMARSNLRAYERCHGLTESDNHLLL